jgi:nitrile hydratase accessory protein
MKRPLEDLLKARGIRLPESTFAEPWEARAFALVLALADECSLRWEDFRQRLIGEIGRADSHVARGEHGAGYFESWLRALEGILADNGIVAAQEIDRRADEIASNPPAPTRASSAGPIKVA